MRKRRKRKSRWSRAAREVAKARVSLPPGRGGCVPRPGGAKQGLLARAGGAELCAALCALSRRTRAASARASLYCRQSRREKRKVRCALS